VYKVVDKQRLSQATVLLLAATNRFAQSLIIFFYAIGMTFKVALSDCP
jgi:hypothetical protein